MGAASTVLVRLSREFCGFRHLLHSAWSCSSPPLSSSSSDNSGIQDICVVPEAGKLIACRLFETKLQDWYDAPSHLS